jgi:hypothetical protein
MIFLDSEFSSYGGQLISIALVSSDGGEFYAVRHLPNKMHPWVEANVIPVLLAEPEEDHSIKRRLVTFLNRHRGETIIADWPEDFIHLLYLLCEPNGYQCDVGDLEMLLVRGFQTDPAIPHNALSDARALRDAYLGVNDVYGNPI